MNDTCEIIVRGQLDTDWSKWFEGLTLTHNDKGETIIAGPIRDQAVLYGILVKMRDLALFLLSCKYIVDGSFKEQNELRNNL